VLPGKIAWLAGEHAQDGHRHWGRTG
jgi:hypothetical protein